MASDVHTMQQQNNLIHTQTIKCSYFFNPSLPEIRFASILKRQSKIGSYIVYRLIDPALMGFFSMLLSYFKIDNLAKRSPFGNSLI